MAPPPITVVSVELLDGEFELFDLEVPDDESFIIAGGVVSHNTTPICRARSGNIYMVGEGPVPPAHPRCRSTVVGLATEPDNPRRRISEPLKDVGYDEWLKTQPLSAQEDILGRTRAKLFLEGRLPLDHFVDYTGKTLTLDQLKARERAAWERAFLDPADARAVQIMRRLNRVVDTASPDLRPLGEVAARAFEWLRFRAQDWVEATHQRAARMDPNLLLYVFMMDFFTGPPVVGYWRLGNRWRFRLARAFRRSREAELSVSPLRRPRGLFVHPEAREVPIVREGEIIRPPAPKVPVRTPFKDGPVIDITPNEPVPPNRPIVPPAGPDSIIVPPRDKPRLPSPSERPPSPVEKLPPIMHVEPKEPIVTPKIVAEPKVPPPAAVDKDLPNLSGPLRDLPALSATSKVPQNPMPITVEELERRLDQLLPKEGASLRSAEADQVLRNLWDLFRRKGYDGLAISDASGKNRLLIGLDEKALGDLARRWTEARRAIEAAQRPPTPPVAGVPAPAPFQAVGKDAREIARVELENARRRAAGIGKPSSDALPDIVPRLRAKASAEEAARIAAARRLINEALADLDAINAGLEGRTKLPATLAQRADFLQRLATSNRLEQSTDLYRPLRWGRFASRLIDSPAKLGGKVLEAPSFMTFTADEFLAFEAGARMAGAKTGGALIVLRVTGLSGDSMLAGAAEAHEFVLPAGSRIHVSAVRRLRASEVPPSLRKQYPEGQEFWIAEGSIVRPNDARDLALRREKALQEQFISRMGRTPLDNDAEQALRRTPYAPFRADDTLTSEWPELSREGVMRLGSRLPPNESFAREAPIAPSDLDAAPLLRRAMAQMINRAGRARPLSDAVAPDIMAHGARVAETAFSKKVDKMLNPGPLKARGDRFLKQQRFLPDPILSGSAEDIARRVKSELDIDIAMFGRDTQGVFGDALLKKDPVAFARMSGYLSNADMSAHFVERLDGASAVREGAEIARGMRLYAEMVDALSGGKLKLKVDGIDDLASGFSYPRAKDPAMRAFESWFALEYSPNPVWRRILRHMHPGLDADMKRVLAARAREDFPDVWSPALKVTHNRRIIANPTAPQATAQAVAGIEDDAVRATLRQRFYDYLEGNGSLSQRAQGALARDLGVSRQEIESLLREAQAAGWVRQHGRGLRVVAESARPLRPVGRPSSEPTPTQRSDFYDYLEGLTGTRRRPDGRTALGSLSRAALADLQKELGLAPAQLTRLTLEAQELGWLARDARGNLRRTWVRGLERGKAKPPMRPTEGDIERTRATLGTAADKARELESPPRAPDDPDAPLRVAMSPDEQVALLNRIASEMRGAPVEQLAHLRLPVRSESERLMVEHVWRRATVTPDVERAIRGADQITLSDNSDGPTYYDPASGTLSPGTLDVTRSDHGVLIRHEFGHHLDTAATPDGTIVQYSASPRFGLAKAMATDTEAIAAGYAPEQALTMTLESALAAFQQRFGIDLSSSTDKEAAHRAAEYALAGNPAFLKAVDTLVRQRAVTDPVIASELNVFADFVGAVTRKSLGTGHADAYYRGGFDIGHDYSSRHAAEAFSNWFALHTSERQGWRALLKQHFPNANEAARSILEGIGQDASGD